MTEEIVAQARATFSKEYKILQAAAYDFIDIVNQKISEVETDEYYGDTTLAKNSIYYLTTSYCLREPTTFRVYGGEQDFSTLQGVQNLLSFLQAVEGLLKDCSVWINAYRVPLKFSKKNRAMIPLWNDLRDRRNEFDSIELEEALKSIDRFEEYHDLWRDMWESLQFTSRTIDLVDSMISPFHKFPLENLEPTFDAKIHEIMVGITSVEEILNSASENIFESRFKK